MLWAFSQELKELYLENNNLMDLPGSIGMLEKLQVLDLHNNKLQELPNTIACLSGITHEFAIHSSLHS